MRPRRIRDENAVPPSVWAPIASVKAPSGGSQGLKCEIGTTARNSPRQRSGQKKQERPGRRAPRHAAALGAPTIVPEPQHRIAARWIAPPAQPPARSSPLASPWKPGVTWGWRTTGRSAGSSSLREKSPHSGRPRTGVPLAPLRCPGQRQLGSGRYLGCQRLLGVPARQISAHHRLPLLRR